MARPVSVAAARRSESRRGLNSCGPCIRLAACATAIGWGRLAFVPERTSDDETFFPPLARAPGPLTPAFLALSSRSPRGERRQSASSVAPPKPRATEARSQTCRPEEILRDRARGLSSGPERVSRLQAIRPSHGADLAGKGAEVQHWARRSGTPQAFSLQRMAQAAARLRAARGRRGCDARAVYGARPQDAGRFDYAFYPSDLYYADLARKDGSFDDWNAVKEGFHRLYVGEVRGENFKHDRINYDQIAYDPEIAFGRWPVSTEQEVRIIAAKTIAYEKSIRDDTHPGERRAAFFNTAGYVDVRDQMNGWSRQLPPGWAPPVTFTATTRSPITRRRPTRPTCSKRPTRVADSSRTSGTGATIPGTARSRLRGLAKLKDADRLPVMISVGCSTANFAPLPPYSAYVDVAGKEHAGTNDKEVFHAPPPPPSPYQKGKYNPTGLGEQLLKHPDTGAVIYIGCNTGAQPFRDQPLRRVLGRDAEARAAAGRRLLGHAIHAYYKKDAWPTSLRTTTGIPPRSSFRGRSSCSSATRRCRWRMRRPLRQSETCG